MREYDGVFEEDWGRAVASQLQERMWFKGSRGPSALA